MSRYHPLDVRHPANKDLLSRNFLLDPPAQDRGQQGHIQRAPAPQSAAAPAATSAADKTAPAQRGGETMPAASPWGERPQPPSEPRPARQKPPRPARSRQASRNGGMLKWLLLIGVIYFFLSDDGRAILRDVPVLDTAVDAVEEILRSL